MMKPKQEDPSTSQNQGEGDREAARHYNDDQKRFVESGAVDAAAKRAAPETEEEAEGLLEAEEQGRKKAKGEDPTVPGANAKTQPKSKTGRRA
jgi:hypothetical protein